MGVRGLTTYISNHSDKYLKPYELHNTYLVIDGNSLAANLYLRTRCNDCFGGDYDKYSQRIRYFFRILAECSVTPIVVFDGAYEDKKLKTIFTRLKDRLKAATRLNSVTEGHIHIFPLFLRELFVDVLIQLGIKTLRCQFEGDIETACLARTLNCPVLSLDSDFYVVDVLYIPFDTVQVKVQKTWGKQKYISCKIFKTECFLNTFGSLDKKQLPLLAVMLGNDYIKRSVFADFYSHLKLAQGRACKSEQQRTIEAVIQWLKHETYESAIRKILGRLKLAKRKTIAKHINEIVEGYGCVDSEIVKLLEIDSSDLSNLVNDCTPINLDTVQSIETGDVYEDSSSEDDVEVTESAEEAITDNNIPEWFMKNYYLCKYPACFMDMLVKNIYHTTPQQEDYTNVTSHEISFGLFAVIHRILTSGSRDELKYIARDKHYLKKGVLQWNNQIQVPYLGDLQYRDKETNKQFLLEVLKVDTGFEKNVLKILPPTWHLYFLSIKFWYENTSQKVTLSHIYALILCAIVINKCDPKVGFYRSTQQFMDKFERKAQNLLKQPQTTKKNACLDDIDYKDSLLCLRELINFFQMDAKMKTNARYFDITILDVFAQFQSCFLHIKYLNSLLDRPFDNVVISEFYDGTFLYNMTTTLSQTPSLDNYVRNLFKHSPTVLTSLTKIVEGLKKALVIESPEGGTRRRRRPRPKKKKKAVVKENWEELDKSDSDDNSLLVNNPFCLLKHC